MLTKLERDRAVGQVGMQSLKLMHRQEPCYEESREIQYDFETEINNYQRFDWSTWLFYGKMVVIY